MDERALRAASFGGVADAYERARPEYPPAAVEWLVRDARVVVDLGAGTGKLTRGVAAPGREVVAVEPLAEMAVRLREAVPSVHVLTGSAESIPLSDASADAVVAGQAFHWFDPPRALPEIARVLRPAGGLGLAWNTRDNRVPWIARLTELMHGEEWRYQPGDAIAASGLFGEVEEADFRHEQRLDRQELLDLVLSRSSVAVRDEAGRAEVLDAAARLFEETADKGRVTLAYVTHCFRTTRL